MFQHYKVSENRIQFCPNLCENVTVIHDFCQAADRERDCRLLRWADIHRIHVFQISLDY